MFSLQMKKLVYLSDNRRGASWGSISRVISRVDPEVPLPENALEALPRERFLELLTRPLHSIEGEKLFLGAQPVDTTVAWEIW